ncbi:MAG: deoxyribose-phosphate aldolase [Acidobacteriota bacterium]|jgi:deoxyribose-phosphate aldolase
MKGEQGTPGGAFVPLPTTLEELARLIDHTLLRPEATSADIARLCAEARQHAFFAVCVNPAWVPLAAAELAGTPVMVCTVVGFPLGAQASEVKAFETEHALGAGAREIDMVLPIGPLKGGDEEWVLGDIGRVVQACRAHGAACKVILETALLTEEEKVRACRLAAQAGADFVKTSTGFAAGGATPEDVTLMYRTVAPAGVKVKASGGIRTLDDLLRMVAAGASRIGTSSGVAILGQARQRAAAAGGPPGVSG